MRMSYSSGTVTQYLVPVLSGDFPYCILVGLVPIPITTLNGKSSDLVINNRAVTARCIQFSTEKSERKLFCLVFPHSSNTGHDPWNGLGLITAKDLGIVSAWACPVGNPDFQRTSIGMLELFVSNKMDRTEQHVQSTVAKQQTLNLQLKLSVNAERLLKKLSFIEFDWLPSFQKYCDNHNLHIHPLNLSGLDCPAGFKTVAYTNSVSSGIPNIIRIMRISQSSDQLIFRYAIDCTQYYTVNLTVLLNLVNTQYTQRSNK